jgi:hypothetical protein
MDSAARFIPPTCLLCKNPPTAGRNNVWLCARHFAEALNLMVVGMRLGHVSMAITIAAQVTIGAPHTPSRACANVPTRPASTTEKKEH